MSKKLVFSTADKVISKYIASIRERSNKLQDDVHQVAVMTSVHVIEHGNVTLSRNLISALGSGMRANSLKKWMIQYAPVSWGDIEVTTDDGKTKTMKGLVYDRTKAAAMKALYEQDKDAVIKNMMEVPFYSFDPEPEFKSFDLDKAIASLLKRAEGIAEDDSKKSKSNLAHLAALKAFATQNGIAVN